MALAMTIAGPALASRPESTITPPPPQPAVRPVKTQPIAPQSVAPPAIAAPSVIPPPQQAPASDAEAARLKRITAARSWGYQLTGASVDRLASSHYDLLVIDAARGLGDGKPFARADIERLKKKPDGSRRMILAHLSIGDVDHVAKEYLEEDAPDWLLHESPDWKGGRLVNICAEGWQRTILGDDRGRSVYDDVEASPLFKLVELGVDGVYLDRVDVYTEIKAQCPNGAERMVDFVVRLASHARKVVPQFLVVQQNAEELFRMPRLVTAVDAVAKEALFIVDGASSADTATATRQSIDGLNRAKAAGRAVFTVDYASSKSSSDSALKRSRDLGFVPYIAPRELHELWLPGRQF